ncbi:MAG TPA: ABC transporter permease [Mycobacteriales bacterium]|nr:ABC transporter permease [Mycobacteriales bacterium]
MTSQPVTAEHTEPGRHVPMWPAIRAVAAGQLSRVRVARVPLLLVATVQSVGIVVLLRGVLRHTSVTTAAAVVAGSTVLVVAFVALNLLAQRFGALRAERALDYYAALPISPGAVVLGTAASYAAFTVPGAVVTAAVGTGVYGLPASRLWMVVPTVLVASLALAGVGSLLGLALPRPELATVAGQLGMTAVLFLGVIPSGHLPDALRVVRAVLPGMLAVDGFADTLHRAVPWGHVVAWFAITVGYGVVTLWLAGRWFRRAVDR